MINARFFSSIFALSLLAGAANAQSLDDTLSRMDATSKGFFGVTADVEHYSYTFVIKDETKELGHLTVYRDRSKPKDTRMLVKFNSPQERAVSFANDKVEMYYPKQNEVQEYNFGKGGRLIEKFLLLGFGSTGKELRASYDVKYLDTGIVGGGKADHLELTPKSPDVREYFAKIELWITQNGGYPVRVKLLQPARDYQQIDYTNVHVNPSGLDEKSVRLEVPKGTHKVNLQKP
jgi:outer membrane lipoprotein-sorting protein